jgi:superfamily II DNA or RNA helicase
MEAINEILRAKRHLCRAEVGAGKTLVAVEAVLRSGVPVTLVVGPLNTRSGWQTTFARQSGGTTDFYFIDGTKKGMGHFHAMAAGRRGVYFMSWQRFRMYDWQAFPIDFIIYDEVHEGQNRKSGTHLAMLSAFRIPYQVGLSATLAGNRVEGQWAIQYSFWPEKEITPAFWTWVTTYLKTELHPQAGKAILGEKVPGTVWSLLPSKSAFPSPYQEEPLIFNIEVDLLPAQRKLYDRFEKEAVVWLENHPLVEELPAIQQLRLRQMCLAVPSIRWDWKSVGPAEEIKPEWELKEEDGRLYRWAEEVYFKEDARSTKAEAIIEQLRHLYENGGTEPVMIYTHSRKFATMLTLRLQAKGYRARRFVGGMSDAERTWKREAFGIEYDIMVATQAAVGIGTDGIQNVCRIEFWASLSDNRMHNKQAVGRLSRPGQERTVLRYNFLARDTVEVRRLAQMQADQEQLDASYSYEPQDTAA